MVFCFFVPIAIDYYIINFYLSCVIEIGYDFLVKQRTPTNLFLFLLRCFPALMQANIILLINLLVMLLM